MSSSVTLPPPPPDLVASDTTAERSAMLVLLVEDSPSDARLIEESLRRAAPSAPGDRVVLRRVALLGEAIRLLGTERIDAVLLDLSLPDSRGIETFRRVHRTAPHVPIVVLSGLADEALAATAVREGAQDYLVKGQVDGQVLVRSLRYAIARFRAESERAERLRAQWARAQAEAAQLRLALLASASRAFAEAGTRFEIAAKAVVRSVARAIGDGCALLLLSEDERTLELAALHHTVDTAADLATDLLAAHPIDVTGTAAAGVVQRGETLRFPVLSDVQLRHLLPLPYLPYAERFPVHSVVSTAMRTQAAARGMIVIWRDVTPEVYTQDDEAFLQDLADRAALALENARLYAQVQEALRTRDAFLGSVAHDLKSPLTTIKVQAQLLARTLARAAGDSPPLRGAVDRAADITATVDKMTRMLDELLDLTRLQMGQPLVLLRKPVDIAGLARRVAETHQEHADLHTVAVQAPHPVVGEWDEVRLERVLNNLIGNAIKYSPDGGRVEVTVTQERSDGRAWARLTVSDEGLGIPEADLPHVFERFRRAGNVADRIRGTGIGLSSSKQIVEQHGGSIAVTSREGAGSTFTVWLPVDPPAGHTPHTDP